MANFKKNTIVYAVPILLILIFSAISPRFGLSNLTVVSIQTIVPTIMGFAIYQCMAAGLFDLSIGARIIFSSFIGAALSVQYGIIGLIVGCIIMNLITAFISGTLYTVLKIPSMVLAMCLILILEPLPYITLGVSYISVDRSVAFLGKRPYNIIIFLMMFLLFYFICYHSKYSCQLRAVGGEENIAKTIGIKTNRIKFASYMVSGLFSGVASILYMCYANNISAQDSMGSIDIVFKPLMGVMIAMELTSFINVGLAILIGEFCISIIFNGLVAVGMPDTWQDMILGLFMLCIIGLTSNRYRLAKFFKTIKTHQKRKLIYEKDLK
ncbi:MAG: ABC transporter permease [Lachnospiraceae bacterium]|nr:ABC transporter permease [Lachnospiraceae bacterium]